MFKRIKCRKKFGNWLKVDDNERLSELFLGNVNKKLSLTGNLCLQKGNWC